MYRTNVSGHIKTVAKITLHKIGNQAPYFSVTGTIYEHGRNVCGGCIHDEILAIWPDLAPVVALHLSDIDGVPMHFVGNGWYDLAGALGGAGERYHVGNSERHFPITPDPKTPWRNTEYRHPTKAECLQIFADHCRIPLAEAAQIAWEVECAFGPENESHAGGLHSASDYARGRKVWEKIAATMLPRFKAEADAAIEKFRITVETS